VLVEIPDLIVAGNHGKVSFHEIKPEKAPRETSEQLLKREIARSQDQRRSSGVY